MYEVLDVAAAVTLSTFPTYWQALDCACEAIDGRRHIVVKDTDTGVVLLDDAQPFDDVDAWPHLTPGVDDESPAVTA